MNDRVMLTLADYRRELSSLVAGVSLTTERVAVAVSRDRILSSPILATTSVPPERCSAMDGYAIRRADLTAGVTTFAIIDTSRAGGARPLTPHSRECVDVATGAKLPDDADVNIVLPIEHVVRDENQITVVPEKLSAKTHIRDAGESIMSGVQVALAGERVTARHIATFAASGVSHIDVVKQPRIVVISTGDEIISAATVGCQAHAGVYDTNGPFLRVAAETDGAVAQTLHVADDAATLIATLDDLSHRAECDLVVISGGVSVGERDIVGQSFSRHGTLCRVAMKPGSPQAFSLWNGVLPVIGLPGNPYATIASYYLLIRPILGSLLGRPQPANMIRLASQWERQVDITHSVFATRCYSDDGELTAKPLTESGHSMMGIAQADLLLESRPSAPTEPVVLGHAL